MAARIGSGENSSIREGTESPRRAESVVATLWARLLRSVGRNCAWRA
jgi:hypothetical protein